MSATRRTLLARTGLAAAGATLPAVAVAAETSRRRDVFAAPPPDPLAEIGRAIDRAWRERNRIEEEAYTLPEPLRSARLADRLPIEDHRDALEVAVPTLQAATLEGAMVQVMLAWADADTASDYAGSDSSRRYLARVREGLYSVMALLERESGTPREDLGGEFYLPRRLDPRIEDGRTAT